MPSEEPRPSGRGINRALVRAEPADAGALLSYVRNSYNETYHRGFAYGRVKDGSGGYKERLLVPTSRAAAPDPLAISVVGAQTGDKVSELSLNVGSTIPDRDWPPTMWLSRTADISLPAT